MAWKVSWRVRCERCNALGPPADLSAEAERKAIQDNWLKGQAWGMALHLCPECVALGLPDWWPDATSLAFRWKD